MSDFGTLTGMRSLTSSASRRCSRWPPNCESPTWAEQALDDSVLLDYRKSA
ncbi:MAG: hypothetical protein WCA35_18835 [Kovacikia sp.]